VAAVIAFGINMTLTVVSPFLTNLGLMAYGRLRATAMSVAVSVVVTLASLLVVEAVATEHAVWALVGGNVLMTSWQIVVLVRAVRRAAALTPSLTPNNPDQITAGAGAPPERVPYG
jgi:hypothetical protein